MRKIILTFGLISGAISSLMMIVLVTFGGRIGFDRGAIIGNTSIVLSFLMVFFGIRTYRDNIGNGQMITFKSLAVGLSITLISCIFMRRNLGSDLLQLPAWFLGRIWRSFGAEAHRPGASPAAVQAKLQQVRKYKELYKNPFFNAVLSFIDPFPIGVVITLISALVLRRKPQPQPEQSPLPAS